MNDAKEAVRLALKRLEGAFALGILFSGAAPRMFAARKGSPLALGHGHGESYLGSDAMALSSFTQRLTYLEEGDWAELHRDGFDIFDEQDRPVERPMTLTQITGASVGKENYRHFMEKEIHEQPQVIGERWKCFTTLPCSRCDCRNFSFPWKS